MNKRNRVNYLSLPFCCMYPFFLKGKFDKYGRKKRTAIHLFERGQPLLYATNTDAPTRMAGMSLSFQVQHM